MKIVIKRHASDFQVFRAVAIAQAAAGANPGAEIFIESLERHSAVLKLFPSIKWKNPHHPFEVGFRQGGTDGNGAKIPDRKAGKIYDEVIDIDADSPLEFELLNTGIPWWEFIGHKLRQGPAFSARLKPALFPTIETIGKPLEGKYVILAPLSEEADPRALNVNKLEAFARGHFPSSEILWVAPGNVFLGPGRDLARYDDFVTLAGILAGASAVIGVNGIVAALAQSIFEGKPLVRLYAHVIGVSDAKRIGRDIALKRLALMEIETARPAGAEPVRILKLDPKPGDLIDAAGPRPD